MAFLTRWSVLTAVFLSSISSASQKIFFEQLTTADGLPSDYVNSVFRDSKGFLWIATDKGACRYDGEHFLYLNKDDGLPSNFVNCFAEDPGGGIWMGTIEGGVCKYDGKKITSFLNEVQDIFKNTVQIHFNEDSSFFLVTSSHLYYCRSEKSKPEKVKDCTGFLTSLSKNSFISGDGFDIYHIEKSNHELKLQKIKGKDFFKIAGNEFLKRKGDELSSYLFDGKDFIFKRKFVLKKIHLPGNTSLLKDLLATKNALFIATSTGLIYTDEKNNELFLNSANGMGADYIRSIYEDKNENVFLCTFGGGVKIWPTLYLREFKTDGKITSLFPAGKHIYVTTTSHIYNFNPVSGQLSTYPHLSGGNYTVTYQSSEGRFYMGTMNSFYELPDNTYLDKFIPGSKSPYFVTANSGISGFFSKNDQVYTGTYGDGILLFNRKNKTERKLNNQIPGIIEFLVPMKNSFAALTYSSGVTLFAEKAGPVQIRTSEGLLSNTVYSVFQEKDNEVWIGTFKGLNLYNGKKVIKTFSADEGLNGTKVICIFRDAQKRFWVLSDKYLHLLENDKLRAIRSHPVLYDAKNSINRAVYDKENDLLYIGLNNSLLTVDLKKVLPDTSIQQPALNGIRIDTSLKKQNEGIIKMPARSGKTSFSFSTCFTPLSKRGDIYYKLKGMDDEWRLLDLSFEAIYQKLPAGDYELFAKTINPDGYASEAISLLKLEVMPPFWKRSWFIIVFSIVLLTAFFFTGQAISRKRYRQKIRQLQKEQQLQIERERIAMELHDNIGSQLTYLINKIDDDYPLLSNKEEAGKLGNFARGAMQELRETIWALDKKEILLYELDDKVMQLAGLYNREKDIVICDWNGNAQQPASIKSLKALNIYRIIQESLNNAIKYSGADVIRIIVSLQNDILEISISDNGKGFDPLHTIPGYGLRNMKARAKEMNSMLNITSEQGNGTCISLTVGLDGK